MTPCVAWAPWNGCNPQAQKGVFWWALFVVIVLAAPLWILRNGRK